MDERLTAVVQSLHVQGGICAQMGSPFSQAVALAVAGDIAAGGVFAALAEPWAGRSVRALFDDATPLRFLGGLHFLALSGGAPDLAVLYPPQSSDPEPGCLSECVARAGVDHREALARILTSPPQTNEVNRSICLIGGFLTVARRAGLPLRCLELGASAGLNLNWDRFRYDLDDLGAWGDAASPVRLGTEWEGPAPPFDVAATVVERLGCDQHPIDVSVADHALRLKSYVWPDQAQRMTRLDGAIALARLHPPPVERADAAAWARTHAHGVRGAVTVLYHSVVWQYFSPQTQGGVTAAIRSAGESATLDAPFAWLRMEPDPANMSAPMEVRLTYWPGGDETLLARVHPHGAKVSWIGAGAGE